MEQEAAIDVGNSTTTPLEAGATYTGTWGKTARYGPVAAGAFSHDKSFGSVTVTVFASHDSAANGLAVEQSPDGINADVADYLDVKAGQAQTFIVNLVSQYYRLVYVNGGSNQDTFRLQARLNPERLPLWGSGRSNVPSKFAQLAATTTSDTDIVAAPGANKSILVRGISATNDSATLTRCAFKDGTTTFYEHSCAANGGGFGNPLKQEKLLTENAALKIDLSTGVTSVYCNAEYVIVKS